MVRLGLISNKHDNGVVLAFGSVEVVLVLLMVKYSTFKTENFVIVRKQIHKFFVSQH